MSASTSLSPGCVPKRRRSPSARAESTSTATTWAPASSSSAVSTPCPGPISSTVSPDAGANCSTMRRAAGVLERKCCPSARRRAEVVAWERRVCRGLMVAALALRNRAEQWRVEDRARRDHGIIERHMGPIPLVDFLAYFRVAQVEVSQLLEMAELEAEGFFVAFPDELRAIKALVGPGKCSIIRPPLKGTGTREQLRDCLVRLQDSVIGESLDHVAAARS